MKKCDQNCTERTIRNGICLCDLKFKTKQLTKTTYKMKEQDLTTKTQNK